jgi:hypothetical protein
VNQAAEMEVGTIVLITGVVVAVAQADGTTTYRVEFDQNGKIAGDWFSPDDLNEFDYADGM